MPTIWTNLVLAEEARSLLEKAHHVTGPGVLGGGTESTAGIEDADAVISAARPDWDEGLFRRTTRLKLVARNGIGVDSVDLAAATAAGICVVNTPDSPTEATAEFAFALMLAVARNLCFAERRMRIDGWLEGPERVGFELAGKTLGLAGMGRVGTRMAEIARVMRMTIIAYDPGIPADLIRSRGAEPVAELQSLLARADVVSLHIPLTAATRGLIGARELGWMKPGAVLINAARGPLVDKVALLAALERRHLRGAGLDVWDAEPASADNPLLKLDNVVASPHLAGSSAEASRAGHLGAARAVLEVLEGRRPPALVNPEVWDRRRR